MFGGEVLLERTEKKGIVSEIKQKQLITWSPNLIFDWLISDEKRLSSDEKD